MPGPKIILKYLWIAITTAGSIVALASFFDTLILWSEFIQKIISSYRSIASAIWTPLLELLPFIFPRWVDDILTLNALSAAAVLWALHNAKSQMGSAAAPGSMVGRIIREFKQYHLGGNTFTLFGQSATKIVRAHFGEQFDETHEKIISNLSRVDRDILFQLSNILLTLILIALALVAPYLTPFVMTYMDWRYIRLSGNVFEKRAKEVSIAFNYDTLAQKMTVALLERTESFYNWRAIDTIYYKIVLRSQLWYYFAVFVLFGFIVFTNYLFQSYRSIP